MMSTTLTDPRRQHRSQGDLRTAGAAALAAGLAHLLFAVGGGVLSAAGPDLLRVDFPLSELTAYRWYGLAASLLTLVWALAATNGLLALGRLVWTPGTQPAAMATAAATAAGTLIVSTSGLSLAMFSGATADVVPTGADIPAQQAVLQGVWIVLHGAWYAASWIVALWLAAFAIAARRTRMFGVPGLVLTLLAAVSVVTIVLLVEYPTALPFASLALLTLGIVLLVRARRAGT